MSEVSEITILERQNYTTISNSQCTELISYINENINEYVKEVLLKLPDNKKESKESLVNLLNNSSLEKDLKVEIIKKQETRIDDISKVTDQELWGDIFTHNRVTASWENIYKYYEILEADEKRFDNTLIDFLNEELNYTYLSKENLDSNREEKFIDEFIKTLLLCAELKLESIKALIHSIPYIYKDFENLLDGISSERMSYLIDLQKLGLTNKNIILLKDRYPDLEIKLIVRNIEVFLDKNKFDSFNVSDDDIKELFTSPEINSENKLKLLKILLESPRFLPEQKLGLINSEFSLLVDQSSIIEFISMMGDEYRKLFTTEQKLNFENNKLHKELFQNLKERNLIDDFKDNKQNKDLIRVTAKKIQREFDSQINGSEPK